MTAILNNKDLYIRDISQAYIQSATTLNYYFYIKPPKKINLGQGNILKVLQPLYNVPEAGTHWFRTYHKHYTKKLNLTTSIYDPCLLYNSQAIVGLQTDNTLYLGTPEYT